MKMNIVFLLSLISSLGSCSSGLSSDKMHILNPERIFSDSVLFRENNYMDDNSVSIMWDNMAFCDYMDRSINLHINQSNDSLYIYDATNDFDTRLKLPFKIKIPVKGLYFHNYDSIFVFFDREFVINMRNHGNEMDDFIIIDSSANVKGRYSLNEVPLIFNGQTNPMIFYSKASFVGSMMIGEIIYIPFAIYKPSLADTTLKEMNIQLLCAYNLKTHEIKMMNVKFPKEDIGKKYLEGVRTNTFDYYIFNSNTMYISFLYSSDIYKLDLKSNKLECIRTFNDFCFNNIFNESGSGSSFHTWFYAPEYSQKQNLFVRKIQIDGYNNFKSFSISQVLDINMNLIGYSFEDSIWSSFSVDSKGEIVTYKKDDHYLSYRVTGFTKEELSLKEIENRYLVKKEIQPAKTVSIDKSQISFNDRMMLYINDIEISQPVKLVLISSDVICGHCIEFLMNELQNNKEVFINQNIKYVFHGTDVLSMVNIINSYHLESRFYFLDTKNTNSVYFSADEMQGYPLVVYQKNKIHIVKTDFSNMEKDFARFKKKKL